VNPALVDMWARRDLNANPWLSQRRNASENAKRAKERNGERPSALAQMTVLNEVDPE
jgi:hypothetical protein